MRWPRSVLAAGAVSIGAVFVLYAWRLSDTPVYLHDAEVLFALHARAIAATLHDANGRLLPLYIQMPQIGTDTWFHPMLVYFTAAFLRVLPLTEWALRLPTVFVGVIDIALMYFVARRVFDSRGYGWFAAALLAMTPAHFIHSRFALDYIYPVPFTLAWLWCVVRFEQHGDRRWLFGAGLTLGIGFYSYIGAVMLMPVYLLLTLCYIVAKYRRPDRALSLASLGFVLPLTLLLAWLAMHPTFVGETIGRYGVSGQSKLHALRALLRYQQLQDYIAQYWNLNSPVYLFFVGSSNWVDSTRRAGVFLLPMAILLVAGLCDFVMGPRTMTSWLVVAGVATAPIGAVFVGEPWAVQRELELLPFAVLLAVYGTRRLLRSPAIGWRVVAVAALVAMPLQFADFCRDYFTAYRLNSLGWFGSNLRGAVAEVVRRQPEGSSGQTYVSTVIPYALDNWQLYLAKAHRDDLWPLTHAFDKNTNVDAIPKGSFVVEPLSDGRPMDRAAASPALVTAAVVKAPEGGTQFAVLERR